jgi:hypothetical protein
MVGDEIYCSSERSGRRINITLGGSIIAWLQMERYFIAANFQSQLDAVPLTHGVRPNPVSSEVFENKKHPFAFRFTNRQFQSRFIGSGFASSIWAYKYRELGA